MPLKDVFEMYDSLMEAINQAGGSGASFRPKKLHKMTVLELMEHLAPNKVRFVCIKEPVKPKRKTVDEEDYK
jgi:hypothetical protein